MDKILNSHRINYVLYHLKLYYNFPPIVLEKMKFVDQNFNSYQKGNIYFCLSDRGLSLDNIKYYDNIPVIFPNNLEPKKYSIYNESLIFHDDLLKSAFYFLSGYQEYNRTTSDNLGRFNFCTSIHKELNITSIPVVNYYFDIVYEAINHFLKETKSDKRIQKTPLFKNFGFLLTHDVDRVKLYTFNNFAFKIKQLLGLSKISSGLSFKQQLQQLIKFTAHSLNPFSNDPYWNFRELLEYEASLNIKSVWFFLQKNKKHVDSYYCFTDKKIAKLIRYLKSENHEVGLHGTVQSANDEKHFAKIKQILSEVYGNSVLGTRQHRLIFDLPHTAEVHSQNNIAYDSSLGYAHHEGFRNSFCLPFRLYNFAEEKAFSTWEFPLNVMDNTLLGYRNLNFEESRKNILEIIKNVKKFNGLFTLLWHNHYFNEVLYPGITEFYKNLLKEISSLQPENILGNQVCCKLEENSGNCK